MRLPDRDALRDPAHVFLYEHDRLELHSPDARSFMALMYRQRFQTVIDAVVRHARGPRVLDVGCAQGNFSLALAERGYHVVAVDLQHAFLRYLRKKYERGRLDTVAASLEALPFRRQAFDVVLLGEVVEHVAHPDRLFRDAATFLRPDGILVATTPNGDRLHTGLPTLSDIPDRAALEAHQFKPDADGHLFLLTREEFVDAVEASGLRLVSHRFYSSPWITGRLRFRHAAAFLPVAVRRELDRFVICSKYLSRRLSEGQLVVAERQKASQI
jgi:SAM-dependent methyltransferase